MLQRVANVLVNLVRMPNRIKDLHAFMASQGFPGRPGIPADAQGPATFARISNDLAEVRSAVADVHEQSRWAEYFAEVSAVNATTLLRRTHRVGKPFHVLFLIHHVGAWASVAPVIQRLSQDPDFIVTAASIGPKFRGRSSAGTRVVDEELDRMGVTHIRLPIPQVHQSLRIIEALSPDVIFRQSQWDQDYEDAFKIPSLDFTRLCYIPYETMNLLEVAGVPSSETALTSQLHQVAWRVYWANETALAQSEELMGRTMPGYVATGHPKLEHIRAAQPWWPLDGAKAPGARTAKRVLWSAHHSVDQDWTKFGMFPQMIGPMTRWARAHKDVQVVLMSHPLLEIMLRDPHAGPWTDEMVDHWFEQWNELPNTAVYTGADYAGLFKASDAMITDGISMLLEYQIVGKPLVFVERDGHRAFNCLGEVVMDGLHRTPDVGQALKLLQSWLNGAKDTHAPRQPEVVAALFAHDDAAERIVADLKAGLEAASVDEGLSVDAVSQPR
ncbi:MAG: hypothetical protein FWD75_08335 [Propionibacteriaceae bacterium]|nr:hypothetical protein [Propionibacteriaceae bacterium]